MGLDRPLPVQYVTYVRALVRGDMGVSYKHRQFGVERLVSAVSGVS